MRRPELVERVNLALTLEQVTKLREWARDDGRPLPNLIRYVLDRAIAQQRPQGTYAEVAETLIRAAGRPMTTVELLDAMTAAGRPVNGKSRKHRLSTLTISFNRSRALMRLPTGWWLR